MNLLTDIKNWFILILLLLSVGIWIWGDIGWHSDKKAQATVAQLQSQLELIKTTADAQLKKQVDSEKSYRTAYLFEKKQIDNMQDPDESLGCEEATQKAISDVLKLKDKQ